MKQSKLRGVSVLFLCTAMYGLYGIYARMMATEFQVFSQNLIRNIIVLVFALLGFLLTRKKWLAIAKNDIPWIVSWVCADIAFVISSFILFNHIAIGTALFLIYAGTTISSYIGGVIFLREKMTKIKVLAVTLSFVGLVIIYGNQLQIGSLMYLVLGFFTGIVSGGWNIFPKKISSKYSKLQLVSFDVLGIIIVNFIFSQLYHQIIPQL